MQRVLNYRGVDYYDLKALLKLHPTQSHIGERKEIKNQIFTFYGRQYVTQDVLNDICEQIDLAEHYYSKTNLEIMFECEGEYDIILLPILSKICEVRYYKNNTYFKKEELIGYSSLSNLYSAVSGEKVVTAKELVRHHNKSRTYFMGNLYISQNHLNFLYRQSEQLIINNQLCIRYRMDPFKEFEQRCNRSNEITSFDIYFDGKYHYPITMELIRKYYLQTINKSTASHRHRLATIYIHAIDIFLSQLTKEIEDYNERELLDTVFCNPILITNKMIVGFVEYVKAMNPNFLPNVEKMYLKANNTSIVSSKDIFEPEEFAAIYYEGINVKRHVENAYNDHAYAQYWLYILLQLSNFIRSSDILNFPILKLPKEYEWGYFCDHDMSEAEANSICNVCEISAKNILIGKTQEKKRIYITRDMQVPLAVALVICNGYAQKRKLKVLFSHSRGINAARIYNKMGEPFYQIGNHKMNYSLATYFEQTGNEANEYRNQVYTYLSYMRGHKVNGPMSVSNTTAIYIKAANKDQSISNMSYHATQRGAFGWLYHVLLDYTNEKFDSLDEETNRILELQNRYTPENMEDLSEFVINDTEERVRVLNQLKQFDRNHIKDFLSIIGIPGTFKTMQAMPCIMGKHCNKTGNACLYCEFSIKTINAIRIYKNELYTIIERLSDEIDDNCIKKYMYLAYKILLVIKDIRMEFGTEYLASYIDMVDIKEKMDSLPKKNTALLQEVLDGNSEHKTKRADK